MTAATTSGRVVAVWRYPVKSMAGERLDSCEVTATRLLGDRGYALVDEGVGLVGSAKNPRAWPDLLAYRAIYLTPPATGAELPGVAMIGPDGRVVTVRELSATFGRQLVLTARAPERPVLQHLHPADGGRAESVTDEAMPPGTFFDLAAVNVLFTTTLARLEAAHPDGEFAVARFRPNILIEPDADGEDDPEASVVGKVLEIGAVRLRIDSRCGRCVMTTLAQPGLSKDTGILKAVARANGGFAGLNVSVECGGVLRVGDPITVP